MSKTIDEKVVQMRFDNKDFESNVKTSMSTLDKLKQKLNFKDTSKSLSNLTSSVKTVDLSALTSAVELISSRFTGLGVAGVTALQRITNAAIDTGASMVKALTFEPVMTGFQEYETQIGAIQTILANTQSKGSTLDDVNAALDELNHYADMTIYNFTEMTKNIGTFTAAGVDLDKAVTSIKGIANLGAVSGSTSIQVSTAMYQLSQALAAGRVSLMDWNSVVNAGMGGEVFQTALKRTAEHMGADVDGLIEKYGSFRESLTQGQWLTADVLTETLTQLSGAYTEADLIAQGYTEDQAKEITSLADTAVSAATDVKTFTQLWSTMKEAVQSGWTNTWELIIGDFGESKQFLSGISNQFNDMVNASADARNTLLAGALDSNWDRISDQLHDLGYSADDLNNELLSVFASHDLSSYAEELIETYGSLGRAFQEGAVDSSYLKEAIENLSGSMGDLQGVATDLEFGTGFDGYSEDVAKIQTALEKLGYDIGEVDGQLGTLTQNGIAAFQAANGLEVTGVVDQSTLDAMQQLIDQANDLSTVVEGLGYGAGFDTGFDESTAKVQQSLKDLGYDVGEVDGQFGDLTQAAVMAFQEANGLEITGIIDQATLDKMSEFQTQTEGTIDGLKSLADEVDQLGGRQLLQQSFQNLIDAFTSFKDIVGNAFKNVFGEVTSDQIYNIIQRIEDFTSRLVLSGDTAEKVQNIFEGIFTAIKFVADTIGTVFSFVWDLLSSDGFSSFTGTLFSGISSLGEAISSLDFSGILDGLSGILTNISDAFSNLLSGVTDSSTGLGDIFSGITSTIGSAFDWIIDKAKDLISFLTDNVSGGDIFAGLLGGGIFITLRKISGLFDKIGNVFKPFSTLFENLFGDNSIASKFSEVLDGIKGSLESFTSGLKAGSLLMIASAIGILALSISSLAEIEGADLAKSLVAVAALMIILSGGFALLSATLSKFSDARGYGKASIALVALATAVAILSNALVTISELSWSQLIRGLVGVAGGLALLVAALKFLDNVKINLRTSIAMLALAEACNILAEALESFSSLSWGEIARGLTAMGGALGELVGALVLLDKFGGSGTLFGGIAVFIASLALGEIAENLQKLGSMSWGEIGRGLAAMGGALGELGTVLGILGYIGGFGALLGAIGIFIASKALNDIATNLKSLSEMSWDEIGRGLSAMGGALFEFGVVLGALSYIGGFGAILGAIGIFIASKALNDIATNLKSLSEMSWEEIAKGLVAMGGALTELGIVIGLLGGLTGFKSIFGSLSILIAVQALQPIADALDQLSDLSWDEIGRGLSAMGGALGELGIVSGILGGLAGFRGILGSVSILIGVQALQPIAEALDKLSELSWGDIARGLVAMGGALLEVGGISTALGTFAPIASLVGSGSLAIAVQGLDDLADALTKFAGLSWDEIGRGLAAMGGALGETALGGLLNTFSGIGGLSLQLIAPALGTLADSLIKWTGITVPENLGQQLGELATGIGKFNFTGMGAGSIAIFAGPVGTLADSVKKWAGVSVRDDLPEEIGSLAQAIGAFTFGGLGAVSLAIAAQPVGQLADSVSKWQDVTVPEGLEDDLKSLARGVQSFTFAFAGGWSIGALKDNLGDLAGSVTKWEGVSVPENIQTDLGKIANGVKAFSFAFLGGWSIGALKDNLAALPDAIAKWDGVVVPENIQTDLEKIASGVKAFTFAFGGSFSIALLNTSLGNLADSINKWQNVSVPDNIEEDLGKIASGVQSFTFAFVGGWSIGTLKDNLGALPDVINKWKDVSVPDNIQTDLEKIANGVQAFSFAFVGAWSIGALKDNLGGLADAINKWKDVSVPDNIQTDLEKISGGVNSFSFAFVGAWSIGALKDNLGGLADAVNKFSSVEIPDDIKTDLENISGGVNSFSFAFGGAFSIAALSEPLGNLADSVAKFSNITISDSIKTDLENISGGVNSFSFAFGGAFSISALTDPLGNLAGSMEKWNNVTIPDGLGDDLGSIGEGVKKFNGVTNLTNLGTNFSNFGDGIKGFYDKTSGITIDTLSSVITESQRLADMATNVDNGAFNGKIGDFGKNLSTFGDKLVEFYGKLDGIDSGRLNEIVTAIQDAYSTISEYSDLDTSGFDSISSSFSTAVTGMANDVSTNTTPFVDAGTNLSVAFKRGINNGLATIGTDILTLLNTIVAGIKDQSDNFSTAGNNLAQALSQGFVDGSSYLATSITGMMSNCIAVINSYWGNFLSAGNFVASGFASGIASGAFKAKIEAQAMAQQAVFAANAALNINSPSKVFRWIGSMIPEGMALGIKDTTYKVLSSINGMANNSIDSVKDAISTIDMSFSDSIDANPTITPVLDLTDVQNGTKTINTMMASLGSAHLSSSINANRNFTGSSDVVSALNSLRGDLSNLDRPSYSIGGITYDDGSNIAIAVGDLIRAVRLERRS